MGFFFLPGRTDLNHIFLHKYTLHKRYKSQLKTFAVEVASFQIESHSSLASARRRAQLPRASFALKSTLYMCILTRFFPARFFLRDFFQLIQSNQLVGAFFKSENDIFCHHNVHFDEIFFSEFLSFQLS